MIKIENTYRTTQGSILLNSTHLTGYTLDTLGFHPQTQKLEPPCTA